MKQKNTLRNLFNFSLFIAGTNAERLPCQTGKNFKQINGSRFKTVFNDSDARTG